MRDTSCSSAARVAAPAVTAPTDSGEEGPVFGGELHFVRAELSLQDGDLVVQGQDLRVLVAITHRRQAHSGEGVGDSQIGQAKQHSRSSCRRARPLLRAENFV